MSKRVKRFRRSVVGQYVWRSKRLQALGFSSYAAFLKSDLWQATKRKARKAGMRQCAVCHSTHGIQLHHNRYELPSTPNLNHLMALCAWCHGKVHEIAHDPKFKSKRSLYRALRKHRRNLERSPALLAMLADEPEPVS